MTSLPMCGSIAQLVEHRTGIAEVTGWNPVEALIFSGFFFPIAQIRKFTAIITLRFQHSSVQNNLREPESQTARADVRRYRNTVSSALWLQLALLFCYLPYFLLAPFAFREIENNSSTAFTIPLTTTALLMYFNSTLKPVLYCWRMKEVRRAVKDTLSCSR